ncbi:HlyD family efflux transporter periplasmic adaptor subunit [Pseudoalteromonas sp. DL2-H2.2]|uniref:efflux RND transporter periplasmic adaptor subunit n=1 Tax=Pseudoalteromonas sp. DL2-H2.2 TaxID=2908889 RepID=UPI001F3ED5D5|nr:HlyD family efflux transporter periplasmic adaptor subunit [Pseudoalteromonas sp. DL2-H2.2]MCF2909559.1 HlyD family efflux transporter periplasmic adaptor subunit [Pseudoalteromonas sp. DL2-H2.2]
MIKDTSQQDLVVKSTKISWKKAVGAVALIGALGVTARAISMADTTGRSFERSALQVAMVSRGDFVRDIQASGRIVAANAPQVYSPQAGFVDLLVKAGDTVTQGEVIARVNSPTLTNELKQQQAELARLRDSLAREQLEVRRETLTLNRSLELAKVTLDAAERENRRAQLSIKQNLISQIDLEEAVDDLARAKLNYQHAQQEVALGKDTLAFELAAASNLVERQQLVVDELQRQVNALEISAPVSGLVGNLFVQTKAAVTDQQALMTLVDLSAYEAQLQVPESYANELGLGMSVVLKVGASEVYGKLSAISPEVSNREVTTRVRFDHSDMGGIRQNQRLSARILLDSKEDVIKVRRGSFMNAGGNVVYRVEGEVATRLNIRTGASSVNEVEILEGLSPGDQIIVSNYEQFEHAPLVQLR